MDPTSIRYLTTEEKDSAEKLILTSIPKQKEKNSSLNNSSTSKEKRTNEIDDFANSCGFTVEEEALIINKEFTLKQELALYLTSRREFIRYILILEKQQLKITIIGIFGPQILYNSSYFCCK